MLKINFSLAGLPRAGSDQGTREKKRQIRLWRKVHLHEFLFKAVSTNILSHVTGVWKLTTSDKEVLVPIVLIFPGKF